MKMRLTDALSVFGLKAGATFEECKAAYRMACSKYHPDRNPAGLEMMKVVNAAWVAVQEGDLSAIKAEEAGAEGLDLGEAMNAALNAVVGLSGVIVEICGSWIWVGGDTKQHREVFKAAGYHWAPKKVMWHWRPAESKSWSRGKFSMDEIRERHGSTRVKGSERKALAA